MKRKEIVLIGGGGHCKACIDVIETDGQYQIVGIVDRRELIGNDVLGYKVQWNDDDLEDLLSLYTYFFITIGQVDTGCNRWKIFNKIKQARKLIPAIVSPKAYVSKSARIGSGTVVMHNAIINASAIVQDNCIINTSAIVEHDSVVHSNSHISTGAIINGNVNVGNNCMIGSGATILQNVKIDNDIVVGAKALVNRPLTQEGTYVGIPAQRIR